MFRKENWSLLVICPDVFIQKYNVYHTLVEEPTFFLLPPVNSKYIFQYGVLACTPEEISTGAKSTKFSLELPS